MNPFVAKMYKGAENSPALKKWPSVPKYIVSNMLAYWLNPYYGLCFCRGKTCSSRWSLDEKSHFWSYLNCCKNLSQILICGEDKDYKWAQVTC